MGIGEQFEFQKTGHIEREPQLIDECNCRQCLNLNGTTAWWMVTCSQCGNKRCPHATDHRNQCQGKPVAAVTEVELTAKLQESLRKAIFEEAGGMWPDWVYEARNAVKHQSQMSWLPDLLAALEWQGGTIHQAIEAVKRMVAAEKERKN